MKKKIRLFLFIFLIAAGLLLRFYKIEEVVSFGWDQSRDAWIMKEIVVDKKFPLIGPRTGIGHFHLGPAFYYLLAPFYVLTNLDPIAAGYFSVAASLLTMILIFWVAYKVFDIEVAYFSAFLYIFSQYLILIDRVPWNVSLVVATSVLIFYSLFKIYQGRNQWFILIGLLTGFFFHLHFTAVFIPPIIVLSLLFVKFKQKTILWILGALFAFTLFFVPNVVHEIQYNLGDYYKFREFIKYYYHGFHFRFMFYRLGDALIMFESLFSFKFLKFFKYIVPLLFWTAFIVFPKNKNRRFVGIVSFLWFLIPLIGFTLYSGPLSDYYFLLTMPLVIYIIAWLTIKVFRFKIKLFSLLLVLFWTFWLYKNASPSLFNRPIHGLKGEKREVMEKIRKKQKIEFSEGTIQPYLYYIYTKRR